MSDEETQHAIQRFREQYAENERLRAAIRTILAYWTEPDTGRCKGCGAMPPEIPRWGACKICDLRDALGEQYGPHPACPECGMGGDVGADTPNPIPF